MAQNVPTRFGKCKTQQLLGRGATAVVYLAKHEGLDMPVAVKVLRKRLSEEKPQYAERFLREARIAARLEHPHLVRVIDCGIEDGYHYMVMDYVDGPNCLELLGESSGGLDWREAARIIRQAAIGLAYAAEHEVIHRDVKPSNIMIDSSGRARVSDLGLAKLTMKGIVSLTQELHTVGTPNYMSPEQIRSPADLDLRTDIYSLGATFYHMVCGEPPFLGKRSMEVIAQHLSASLEPPLKRKPGLPAELSSMICKMMAKSPDERYQDYDEFCQDLDNLVEGKETTAMGFEDTQIGIESEEELRRVLDELAFGDAIKVEDEEPPSEAGGAPVLVGEEDREAKEGSSEIDPFAPDEFVAYPQPEPLAGESTVLSVSAPEESHGHLWLIIALVVIGVIALIAVGIFASLSGS